jgi:palmitoyltransferase
LPTEIVPENFTAIINQTSLFADVLASNNNNNNSTSDINDSKNITNNTKTSDSDGIGLQGTLFLIFIGFLGILAAITAGLLLHLCFFHVYISFLGITTYEYIKNSRQNVMSNAANTSASSTQPQTTITPASTSLAASANVKSAICGDNVPDVFCCSTINPNASAHVTFDNGGNKRPSSFHCCNKSADSGQPKSHHHKAFYMCSLLEERGKGQAQEHHTFHCCSEFRQTFNGEDFETASESFVHYSEQCTFCSFKLKKPVKADDPATAAMQSKRSCLKVLTTNHHRWKRKWNCCSNVPDSPDVPNQPLPTVSGQLLAGMPRNELTNDSRANNIDDITNNNSNGRSRIVEEINGNDISRAQTVSPVAKRPRSRSIRPWPMVRLRHMLRFIGRYRHHRFRPSGTSPTTSSPSCVKQNQIRPLNSSDSSSSINLQSILPTSAIRNESMNAMPSLPPPSRRKIKNSNDLQELADTLAFVQNQSTLKMPVHRRSSRRKTVFRNRSPTLSPIHESGLSNPASPQPSRQTNKLKCLANNNFCDLKISVDRIN